MVALPVRTEEIPLVEVMSPARASRGSQATSLAGAYEHVGTEEMTSIGRTILDRPASGAQVQHVQRAPKTAVEAVIGSIGPVSTIISCKMALGDVEIQLPTALVPDQLRMFGQPVYVALSDIAGYRAPRVYEREVAPYGDPEIDELEGWLAAL